MSQPGIVHTFWKFRLYFFIAAQIVQFTQPNANANGPGNLDNVGAAIQKYSLIFLLMDTQKSCIICRLLNYSLVPFTKISSCCHPAFGSIYIMFPDGESRPWKCGNIKFTCTLRVNAFMALSVPLIIMFFQIWVGESTAYFIEMCFFISLHLPFHHNRSDHLNKSNSNILDNTSTAYLLSWCSPWVH